MPLQIIKLEVVPVVSREDPDWLKKLFGSFPSAIDLLPSRFSDSQEWPEHDPSQEFEIAWFKGETLKDFAAVDQRLTEERIGSERRTYPFHLATEVVPRCDFLWNRYQEGEGPRWIFASSLKSLWRDDDGDLDLPCVSLRPDYREVRACWVEDGFSDSSGFLVSCE